MELEVASSSIKTNHVFHGPGVGCVRGLIAGNYRNEVILKHRLGKVIVLTHFQI